MLSLLDLQKKATDERELVRAWKVAANGFTITASPGKIETTIISSSGNERYRVSISHSETWCDCQSFKRSKKRRFCKHVGALALLNLGGGEARDLPAIVDLAPALVAALEELDWNGLRSLLLSAAADHPSVYEAVIGVG